MSLHLAVDSLELLRAAVSLILKDEGFQLPTEPARNAVRSAERLLEWIDGNKDKATVIASSLICNLDKCFPKSRSPKAARDRMWGNFYKLRSSDDFREFWKKFLSESIGARACPIFYQFVVDQVMDQLVKVRFPITIPEAHSTVDKLDSEDLGALRYTAGSVMRSLKKKIEKSAHPMKTEMLLCLAEMIEQSGMKPWQLYS